MIRPMNFGVMVVAPLLVPLVALASPYSNLMKARATFKSAKSWHAVEHFSNGRTITLDFVAPDRWRIQPMPDVIELLIGSELYMVRNGETLKLPVNAGKVSNMIQSAGEQPLDPSVRDTARDLGMKKVNGKDAHGYSYLTRGLDVTLFVGSDMLPIQEIVSHGRITTIIDYSNFNAPITIVP